MKSLTDEEVAGLLPWGPLIESLERIANENGADAPARTVHTVPTIDGADAALLMKPGWVVGDIIGVKVVTFFPDNGQRDLPTIQAGFVLFDGRNGSLIGACAAGELTTRRTAAASAAVAKVLARSDAGRLLIVGSGALSPMAALAHAHVRDYEVVEIWGRDPVKAEAVVERLASEGLSSSVSTDLDVSVSAADTISCVTGSTRPLVKGALLRPGTHVDLIGAFTAEMRETDDDTVRRARVFVDTRTDAVRTGELAQPLEAGIITLDDIEADFADLVSGRHPGRESAEEITMFKSAGFALEDLAAARLAFS